MTHLLAAFLCLAGFAALAVATGRQQIALFGRELQHATTRGLRILGTALLLVALALLITNQGLDLGLVMYSGHTSLAAGCVHCALIIHARWAYGPER
jgi:hypothetical protein